MLGTLILALCAFTFHKSLMWLLFPSPIFIQGFPGGSDGKEFACNAGDQGLIPGLGRSRGEGNGNPIQYSCLENPMDRSVEGYSPWGHTELNTTSLYQLHLSSSQQTIYYRITVKSKIINMFYSFRLYIPCCDYSTLPS